MATYVWILPWDQEDITFKKFYLAGQQRLVIFAAVLTYQTSSSYSHFLFIYEHSIQNTFILVPNLDPLPRAIDIHYNTVKLKILPRMETGNCFCFAYFLVFAFLSFCFALFFFFNKKYYRNRRLITLSVRRKDVEDTFDTNSYASSLITYGRRFESSFQ